MKKIHFKYEFLVFLYAYLRQIDLSLDRSRWDSLKPFREYYKQQIQPKKICDLIRYCDLDRDRIYSINSLRDATTFQKINYLALRIFRRNYFLMSKEAYYCCQKLLIFQDYLNSNEETHKLEIEKLRIEFAKFTYQVLQYKLNVKDRERAMSVEHYMQNEILRCVSVNEFIKGFEL